LLVSEELPARKEGVSQPERLLLLFLETHREAPMRKTDPLLAKDLPSNLPIPDDDEPTRPVPLQLIARLAAQDPTVQLKIGVTQTTENNPPTAEEEKKKIGR
jgi:hypothetical protein